MSSGAKSMSLESLRIESGLTTALLRRSAFAQELALQGAHFCFGLCLREDANPASAALSDWTFTNPVKLVHRSTLWRQKKRVSSDSDTGSAGHTDGLSHASPTPKRARRDAPPLSPATSEDRADRADALLSCAHTPPSVECGAANEESLREHPVAVVPFMPFGLAVAPPPEHLLVAGSPEDLLVAGSPEEWGGFEALDALELAMCGGGALDDPWGARGSSPSTVMLGDAMSERACSEDISALLGDLAAANAPHCDADADAACEAVGSSTEIPAAACNPAPQGCGMWDYLDLSAGVAGVSCRVQISLDRPSGQVLDYATRNAPALATRVVALPVT